jgi:ubiquinol-cytochrome c reductase cytochrome b subunit
MYEAIPEYGKIIPKHVMDDGAKVGKGLKFSTNSFTYNECLILIKALNDNFDLKASIQLAGSNNQYIIYIWKE